MRKPRPIPRRNRPSLPLDGASRPTPGLGALAFPQQSRENARVSTAANHVAVAELRKAGATKVKVAVSDIDGVLRGKYLHIDKFEGAVEGGFGF